MRVFTQNDELEKLKQRKRKILEETRKLKHNATSFFEPLKVIKVKRPKSAMYAKKLDKLECGDDNESIKKAPPKFKQTEESFMESHSPRKLMKKRDNDQPAIVNGDKAIIDDTHSQNIKEKTKVKVSAPI